MNKTIHHIRHIFDFLLLLLIIGLGLAGLIYLKFDLSAQIADVILMSVLYVFWGVFHHFHDADLTFKVILEYILMALLVATILILILLRA